MIMDAYTRRLIQIAIDKLGPPPCDFAWIVAGSHARNEVHMLSDQDSAIVLSDDATDNDRIYFKTLSHDCHQRLRELSLTTLPRQIHGSYAEVVPAFVRLETVLQEMG